MGAKGKAIGATPAPRFHPVAPWVLLTLFATACCVGFGRAVGWLAYKLTGR